MIEFAKENMKFVLRIEKILEAVVKEKTYKTLPDIDPGKKGFVSTLMNENYALEWQTYGGGKTSLKQSTDVHYKEGESRIPETLLSDVVKLIQRGILGEPGEQKKMLFEATLHVYDVPRGCTLDDLRRSIVGFQSEVYAEKAANKPGSFYLHFYNFYRAKECYKKLKYTPGQFTAVDLISHKKTEEPVVQTKKKKKTVDIFGFTIVE